MSRRSIWHESKFGFRLPVCIISLLFSIIYRRMFWPLPRHEAASVGTEPIGTSGTLAPALGC